ncbi:MAG: ERCC4 domain-containing protein, partial [Candidatus Nanoarchaeia archaeon]
MKNQPIIIDIREKNSLIPANLIEKGIKIKFESLDIADYLIGDIAIERKTIPDLISSMINKRLFKQLAEIKKYPRYFLLIEGQDKLANPEKGLLLSIITDYQIPILFSEDEEDTTSYLTILKKKFEKPKQELTETQKKLYQKLREWRANRAKKDGVPVFLVAKNI